MVNYQDELNKRILDTMLSGKGVKPRLSELARELSKPRSTIDLRVRLLKNEGIIKGYRPVLDWEKLGFEIQGQVGISCSESSIPPLLDALKKSDPVERVFEVTTGNFDILAECKFKDYSEINDLRKCIRAVDGVSDTDIWLLGSCHKGE